VRVGIHYAAIWLVPWFSCVREFGMSEVEWHSDSMLECLDVHELDIADYEGTWKHPPVDLPRFSCPSPETDLWDRPATDLASFVVQVSRQVVHIM
jgi:hypothetical protein